MCVHLLHGNHGNGLPFLEAHSLLSRIKNHVLQERDELLRNIDGDLNLRLVR